MKYLVAIMLLLLVITTGCTLPGERRSELGDYRPMIAKEGQMFGESGNAIEVLSEEWVVLGVVDKQVSQTEPMEKDVSYFVSNTLPVGTQIYGNEQNQKMIYAEYNHRFIEYVTIEE